MSKHDIEAITQALNEIESELKALNLWGGVTNRPADEAFLDQNPFCLETMSFQQWLEYVLIERFRLMIKEQQALPTQMMVHTYAQELYRGNWHKYRGLIGALQKLDKLISID